MISRAQTNATGQGGEVWPDLKWKEKYPTLVEYLTQDTWEDKQPRELSTVSIKCQDGRVLVVLSDVDQKRSLYMSGETVEKALQSLERAASGPGGDWRAWHGNKKKK